MHPLNFIFCCFLNDSPSFKAIEDEEKNTTRINWLIDKLITKEEFLNEKHHIYPFMQNIYKICVILLIFGNFYVFPQTLYFIASLSNIESDNNSSSPCSNNNACFIY